MSPQPEAAGTLGGVITDLQRLVTWMPVTAAQAHAAADILDKLATEVTEAAELLRRT
ncbi:MAG TPA: hypothetical protein VHT94_14060 [Streptosporangiaceae bacterium]|nr:hypothetical protein [Streptosporangiaceae bacterium]